MRRSRLRSQHPCLPSALALAFLLLPIDLTSAHEGHEGEVGRSMVIAAVAPGGPAEQAGLEPGDRVLALDGEELSTQAELGEFLSRYGPGDTVPLLVDRDGETHELSLTFGQSPQGGVRLGVSLGVEAPAPQGAEGQSSASSLDRLDREECLDWIDNTYRAAEMAAGLGLDVTESVEQIRGCVEHDTSRMEMPIPVTWCDNIFKVHCSGLDLLAEIGDAQVEQCEEILAESLGVDVSRNRIWNTCGEQRVFDRYSVGGEASDEATCRRIFLEECGGELGDAG